MFAAAIYASVEHGVPVDARGNADLPAAALGWEPLFHVERGAILLGAAGSVLLVGWRAMHGEFPVKFGQVEYAQQTAAAAADATAALESRLRVVEVLSGLRDPDDL